MAVHVHDKFIPAAVGWCMAASHIILIVAQQNADENLCESQSIMIMIKIFVERNNQRDLPPLSMCICVCQVFDRKYFF